MLPAKPGKHLVEKLGKRPAKKPMGKPLRLSRGSSGGTRAAVNEVPQEHIRSKHKQTVK
jgi:hypothetical protein